MKLLSNTMLLLCCFAVFTLSSCAEEQDVVEPNDAQSTSVKEHRATSDYPDSQIIDYFGLNLAPGSATPTYSQAKYGWDDFYLSDNGNFSGAEFYDYTGDPPSLMRHVCDHEFYFTFDENGDPNGHGCSSPGIDCELSSAGTITTLCSNLCLF